MLLVCLQKIKLTFIKFRISYHDTVTLYDNEDDTEGLVWSYYGTSVPGITLSSSNSVFVYFRTDYTVTSYGFDITYETINDRKSRDFLISSLLHVQLSLYRSSSVHLQHNSANNNNQDVFHLHINLLSHQINYLIVMWLNLAYYLCILLW